MEKKDRKNRRIAKVYSNTSEAGNSFLSFSASKPYKDGKTGEVRGGRILFEDAATGQIYIIKSASIFEDGKDAVFDIVIDLNNDYNVEELG